MNALLRKPVDILAACPGRLIDFCEAGIISLAKISHLVLDEADRMAEMGFQEQVDDILRRIGDDHPRQTMLFSATLDSSVDQLVKRHMSQVKVPFNSPHSNSLFKACAPPNCRKNCDS